MPVLLLVLALVALVFWLFPSAFSAIPGQRWDPNLVTIKGFRAGVTRQQIEARLGPGSDTDGGWMWTPPVSPAKPGGPLRMITFEMLILSKWKSRWYLSGSQFEYGNQEFVTQIHCADSIWQGTVQQHFGAGAVRTVGNEMSIDYPFPNGGTQELSFNINLIDEFGPASTRAVTDTSISWPAEPDPTTQP